MSILRTLILSVMLLSVAGSEVRAQFIDFQADDFNRPLTLRALTARLIAMGDMRYSIPDENNEINLSDFGGMVAAEAADKDGWNVESWFSREQEGNDYYDSLGGPTYRQRVVIEQVVGTGEAVYRNGTGRALGGLYQWTDQRVDYRVGARTKVRGPNMAGIWNERIGRFSLGLAITSWTDDQDVKSPDTFDIRHFSKTWRYALGATTELAGFEIGAQFDFDAVTISGQSRDPDGFHQDDFTWKRPTTKQRLAVTLPSGEDLEAGVLIAAFQRDGREQANISWSDRFPLNPGGFNYDQTVPTFKEEEDGFLIQGRALYWLGYAPRIGAEVSYESTSSKIEEAPIFLGSRRAQDVERSEFKVGGGFGTSFLAERLTVSVEAAGRFVNQKEVVARSSSDTTGRDLLLRGGVEYFARPDVALRGGYQRRSIDDDVDAAFTGRSGNAYSAGLGYLPKGAIFTIDGYVYVLDLLADSEGGSDRDTDRFGLGVYMRFLF